MDIWGDIKATFKRGSILIQLIYINLAVYIAIILLKVFLFLFQADGLFYLIYEKITVPADLRNLVYQPWSLITYMFAHSHTSFMHILFNLLWLYWFGKIYMQYFKEKSMLGVYILGGLSGAFLYIISYNVFPAFQSNLDKAFLVGASASVYAIVVSTAVYAPGHKIHLLILGPVEIKYIALFSLASGFINFPENPGGQLAHLGGALFGMFYALQYKKGLDFTKGFNNFMYGFLSLFKKKKKIKVTYTKAETDWDYNKKKVNNQKELDRILDKIKKSGYSSLSKSEKETLFRMGNK